VRTYGKNATNGEKVKLGKMGKERDGLTRRRLDNLHTGALLCELSGKPGLSVRVPVNEEYARRLDLLTSPSKNIFSFRVGGEVEVANFATDRNGTRVTPIDIPSLACLSQ
jgi:hypothetical protein